MDAEQLVKISSKALTALVSLRALFRSGVGIKKILTKPAKLTKPDAVKAKQLHGALRGMGYTVPEVERAMKELSNRIDSDSLPDLVKAGLGILNKKG